MKTRDAQHLSEVFEQHGRLAYAVGNGVVGGLTMSVHVGEPGPADCLKRMCDDAGRVHRKSAGSWMWRVRGRAAVTALKAIEPHMNGRGAVVRVALLVDTIPKMLSDPNEQRLFKAHLVRLQEEG